MQITREELKRIIWKTLQEILDDKKEAAQTTVGIVQDVSQLYAQKQKNYRKDAETKPKKEKKCDCDGK